jgi:galactonate dehydratase
VIAVERLELLALRVTHRTVWHVVRVTDDDGRTGLGECSDAGPALAAAWRSAQQLIRAGHADLATAVTCLRAQCLVEPDPDRRLALATVCGGLDQAHADLAARRADQPVWQWLGGEEPRPVPRYANINRALGERRPDDFAAVAAAAVRDGFTGVKCAPFDGLTGADRVRQGLDRIKAAREAIGPEIELMLDAHHLIGPPEALAVADELAELGLRWLEDAVVLDDPDGLANLHRAGIAPLAGGEFAFDVAEVRPALDSGRLAYLMPDVKHAGGITGALRLARAAQEAGVTVSLHNPSGPVATAAGLHLAAVCGGATETEFAYGEVAWRPSTLRPPEPVSGAWLPVPTGPGLGVQLADETLWTQETFDEPTA